MKAIGGLPQADVVAEDGKVMKDAHQADVRTTSLFASVLSVSDLILSFESCPHFDYAALGGKQESQKLKKLQHKKKTVVTLRRNMKKHNSKF